MPANQASQLALIMPCLNERANLPGLLRDLLRQRDVTLQIIVADGGSSDGTVELAHEYGCTVVESPAGRGRQMNAGRGAALADWLLFLHADSRLSRPDQLARALRDISPQPHPCAGHFPLRFFDQPAGQARMFAGLAAKSRSNRPETINGDQGLLISAAFFDAIGGYSTRWPFLEDQAISEAIWRHGRWRTLPDPLLTSARRFVSEGAGRRYFAMMLIMCARRAGLNHFLAQAPGLYRVQQQTQRLALAPLLDACLEQAAQCPGFWDTMADYTLDNAWQPALWLDVLTDGDRALRTFDRHIAARLPREAARPLLAAALRQLFTGPVRAWVRRLD